MQRTNVSEKKRRSGDVRAFNWRIRMKRGKRLTRQQKSIVLGNNLNPKDYQFVENINSDYIKVVNILTGIQKTLNVHKRQKRV